MGEEESKTRQAAEEVRQWLDRLAAAKGEGRSHAAAELGRLGVWTRGSIRTRGSIGAAASNRLPEPERLKDVIGCLADADPEVRREVTSALGEWGGEEAARAIARVLQSEPDEELQLYCVGALRTIGGPAAIEGLRHALEKGTDAVRDAAISAIADLATGGPVDDTEDPLMTPDASQPPKTAAVRVRGAVRTRGGPPARRASNAVSGVVEALSAVGQDPNASEYLRLRAGHVLGFLRG